MADAVGKMKSCFKRLDRKNARNFISVILCIFTLVIFALSAASCSVTSKTYGFERGSGKTINGWKKYNYRSEYTSTQTTQFSIVSDGFSGNALKIDSSSINDARVYRKIRVKANSVYEVSVMIKTENVESGAGANISGYNCTGISSGQFGTSDGWIKKTVYLKTGEGQTSVELSLGLGGYSAESSGTAYFDELTVKKVDAAPEGGELLTLIDRKAQKADNDVSIWFKLLFAVVMSGGVIYCAAVCIRADRSRAAKGLSLSHEIVKFGKNDIVIVVVMTVVCAAFSFYDLGSFSGTPNTYWKSGASDEYVEISFKETSSVSKIAYYTGISSGKGSYDVQYLDENGEYITAATIKDSDVEFYKWKTKDVSFTAKKVRVYSTQAGLWLNEVGFYGKDSDGNLVQIELDTSTVAASYSETDTSKQAENIFDEQDDVRSVKTLMDSTYFDEIYFPRTAYEQIHGLSIYERTHPPLGKVFMQFGIMIFGMNTFGWRFAGTLFGVMIVPLMYAFGLKVFKKRIWAFSVGFLMMFDFMRLAQTRLATIDSYSCFFAIAMYYFMYDYFMVKSYDVNEKKSLVPLLLSGIMFGLGASSKWTCVYTGAGLAIIFFVAKFAEYMNCREGITGKKLSTKKWFNSNFLYTCGICIIFFIFIPCIIYVCSYIPYMASNPDKSLLQIVLDNQEYMYSYHSGLTSDHAYGSKWYTWPLMVKPIWYYVDNSVASGMRSTIVSMGNPLIWWVGIPCIFAAAYFAWRNKDKRMGLFIIAYLLQYAPWILVNRVCFIYHYFTALPFTIFMIVYVLKELTEKKIWPKWSLWIYLGAVLILFIVFYPVLTGITVKQGYVDALKWFSTWYF